MQEFANDKENCVFKYLTELTAWKSFWHVFDLVPLSLSRNEYELRFAPPHIWIIFSAILALSYGLLDGHANLVKKGTGAGKFVADTIDFYSPRILAYHTECSWHISQNFQRNFLNSFLIQCPKRFLRTIHLLDHHYIEFVPKCSGCFSLACQRLMLCHRTEYQTQPGLDDYSVLPFLSTLPFQTCVLQNLAWSDKVGGLWFSQVNGK